MKVCVFGLWHLGCTVSACLAKLGHTVVGLDHNKETISNLNAGKAPLFEPGLDVLIQEGILKLKLSFTDKVNKMIEDSDILWVTMDTPVDENDKADIQYVEDKIKYLIPKLKDNLLVVISSQVPVGFTRHMKIGLGKRLPKKKIRF